MKTLKILFLSTILLVTLLIASSIGLVSCSDEYDDTTLTTNVDELQTQLTTDMSELETKLAALESIKSNLPTIDELNAVAEDATEHADDDEAIAISEATKADATLLTNINTKIDALETTLTEAIDSKVNSADVSAAITAALDEINLADIRTLFANMDNTDLKAMKAFVDNWNGTTLPEIIQKITDLGVNVKEMITSIDVVKTENYWYWGTVKNDGTFGPNNEIKFKAGQELNALSMNLIANINPSNADISRYDFSIKNSQGTELPVINLGTPSKYTGTLTKTNNINNLWTIPTTLDWTELNDLAGYNSTYSSTPSFYDNKMKSNGNTVMFALTATIKDEDATTADEDKREIASPYDLTFDRTEQTASNLTGKVTPYILNSGNIGGNFFSLVDEKGKTAIVYKLYVTTYDSSYSDGFYCNHLSSFNNISDFIYCLKESYTNKTIKFTIHYLNFDGTIGSANVDATFNLIY